MQITFHRSRIKTIAAQLWQQAGGCKVWAFHGEMGSGKTTLIHALCDILKVEDAVGSPTFAIINEYKSPVSGIIFHMDWYRVKDEKEAIEAGCEDCIESGNLSLIEWPEKALQLLPVNTFHIFIEIINEHERALTAETSFR
jgi:tRNA threonylcarbamoyladenosine biosynthesis protein TsaE